MEHQVLISVLMGVYYLEADVSHLKRSIDSILMQTLSDFELLICDNGSSDEALSFIDSKSKEDKRIRILRDPDLPTDLASKLNFCLNNAKGIYVARMDDDDFSYPQRFERQVAYLESHPDIDFVGCNIRLCVNDCYTGCQVFPEFPVVSDFYFRQPYIHPSIMFRKNALQTVGGYSIKKHCVLCEDYDLLLRLYLNGCIGANIQEFLLDYNVSNLMKKRKYRYRWNEAVTRFCRFRDLGVMNKAWPYVLKPLVVGLMPQVMLIYLKQKRGKLKR